MSESKSNGSKWKTLFALAFGYFIDQGEGQSMSVLFPVIQNLWNLSYTDLGFIGTLRSLLQALSAPVWGFAADRFSRKQVIIIGTGIWGVWTAVCGLTQNFGQMLVIRAISGLGLGCLMPATFSLMSDSFAPKQRGQALGLMESIGVLGIIVSTVGLGMLATESLWRWGFIILGLFSVLTGVVVYFFVTEPPRGAAEPELAGKITAEQAAQYQIRLADVRKVVAIPTFWVAIAQGLSGSMPWVVMGLYFITWMVQARGMDNGISLANPRGSATLAFAGIVLGTAISNVVGGILGDWAESKNPRHGRTIVGQVSIISGIPLSYVMLTQTDNWSFWPFFFLCLGTALMISWPGKGAKEPMLQGVLLPELRGTAFALLTAIESGFAAFAAWWAGRIADQIGLTNAMVWTIPVPWILCALVFSFFYWTYPRDAAKLRAQMAQRAIELHADLLPDEDM